MIFRRTLHNKFTAISNSVCVDDSISTDARWCLWYLLTKPVNWEVRVNDIRRISGWGKGKAYNVVNELITAKYLVISQGRQNGGQFDSVSYDVYDEPFTGSPLPEKREPDKRDTVNREHTKDLEVPRTEEIQNTDSNISFDADFEAFWAAYPKRPNNPRKKAMAAYKKARKTTSQEKLLTSVGEYFAYMQGENPKFVAMASTWLNDERWNCDYSESAEVIKAYKSTKAGDASTISDEDLDAVINQYKGIVSDRMAAKRILAAELSSGITLDRIVEAAEKYAMHCKQMRYDGIKINTPILEAWLKFKWREMDAYFISKSPMRKPILRPVSEKRK